MIWRNEDGDKRKCVYVLENFFNSLESHIDLCTDCSIGLLYWLFSHSEFIINCAFIVHETFCTMNQLQYLWKCIENQPEYQKIMPFITSQLIHLWSVKLSHCQILTTFIPLESKLNSGWDRGGRVAFTLWHANHTLVPWRRCMLRWFHVRCQIGLDLEVIASGNEA